MAATPVKNRVFFSLGMINPTTSLDLSPWSPCTLDRPEKELPKSPWKTFPNQSKYLVTGGLSKPNSALRAFTADFVALWPNISVAKSPGKKGECTKYYYRKCKNSDETKSKSQQNCSKYWMNSSNDTPL